MHTVCVLLTLLTAGAGEWSRPATPPAVIHTYDLRDRFIDHFEYEVRPASEWGQPPNGRTWPQVLRDCDEMAFVGSLQGIVNRDAPLLYLFVKGDRDKAPIPPDMLPYNCEHFWLDTLSEPGEWLHGVPREELSWTGLLDEYAGKLKGLVVWDPAVPATMNVAYTIAGADNLGVIRRDPAPDSLYTELTRLMPVKVDLTGMFDGKDTIAPGSDIPSAGSAKIDAYTWAMEMYLKTGKCAPDATGYMLDGWPMRLYAQGEMGRAMENLCSRDALLARRAFFFDLSPFADEAPNDDPGQPVGADAAMFRRIIAFCRANVTRTTPVVAGFPPWEAKYAAVYGRPGTRTAFDAEWTTVQLVSKEGACIGGPGLGWFGREATNLSFHMHGPRRTHMPKPALKTPDQLIAQGYLERAESGGGETAPYNVAPKTYVLFFFGDCDLVAVTKLGPVNIHPYPWLQRERGSVPVTWNFSPYGLDWAPDVMDWYYRHRSPNDHFAAPDCGAGYANPGYLPQESRADWTRFNTRWYRRAGYSATVWILNGFDGYMRPDLYDMYLPFSSDGVVDTQWMEPPWPYKWPYLRENMPVSVLSHVCFTAGQNAADVVGEVHKGRERSVEGGNPADGPQFLTFRGVNLGPQWWAELIAKAREERPEADYTPVDPYTFFYLMRAHLGGDNTHRAAWLADAIPPALMAGQSREASVLVRNDGWETWPPGVTRLVLGFTQEEPDPMRPPSVEDYACRVPLAVAVPPGGETEFTAKFDVPSTPGKWYVRYDLTLEGVTFESRRNIPYQRDVMVGGGEETAP